MQIGSIYTPNCLVKNLKQAFSVDFVEFLTEIKQYIIDEKKVFYVTFNHQNLIYNKKIPNYQDFKNVWKSSKLVYIHQVGEISC